MACSSSASNVDAVFGGRTEDEGGVVDLGVWVEVGESGEGVVYGGLRRVEDVLCGEGEKGSGRSGRRVGSEHTTHCERARVNGRSGLSPSEEREGERADARRGENQKGSIYRLTSDTASTGLTQSTTDSVHHSTQSTSHLAHSSSSLPLLLSTRHQVSSLFSTSTPSEHSERPQTHPPRFNLLSTATTSSNRSLVPLDRRPFLPLLLPSPSVRQPRCRPCRTWERASCGACFSPPSYPRSNADPSLLLRPPRAIARLSDRVAKNSIKGYTDTQTKVRDATSNDPWGPSGTQCVLPPLSFPSSRTSEWGGGVLILLS